MANCLFHFAKEAVDSHHDTELSARRQRALNDSIRMFDNACATAMPSASFSSTNSSLPGYPRVQTVPPSQGTQPWTGPCASDLLPDSHPTRPFQAQARPQGVLDTENPFGSQQSPSCQTLAEALKRYMENNAETKVSCLDMLKKQEESRQQLHVAFMDFLHRENVRHDQAKQTLSGLFDGAGTTEVISDVLRALGPTVSSDFHLEVSFCIVIRLLVLLRYLVFPPVPSFPD